MKISIITVCYNSEATIKDTLESIKNQVYTNIEYIIIDGGSTDNTLKILDEYSEMITILISEQDKGLYDAMNKGITLANGDVIGILNSDDLYQDSKVINEVMCEFNNNSELDILYGDLVYVKSDNTDKVIRNWISKKYYSQFFEDSNVPPHPSLFVRRKVYSEAGLFDLDFKIAADYEFMLRIFKKNNFNSKYLNRLIVRMRLGGASNSSVSGIIDQNKEVLKAWKKNKLKKPIFFMPLRIYKRLIQFIKI
jgi:glycosyltransferase involved in cell wall biosynthesis